MAEGGSGGTLGEFVKLEFGGIIYSSEGLYKDEAYFGAAGEGFGVLPRVRGYPSDSRVMREGDHTMFT
eukprot:scaffold7258_cov122-Isochrysis_galbana.AAC.2